MANVTDIIQYYVNLIIIQYHNQPKAQATIALYAQELLASGIFFDIQNAFNLDTAIGVQLDIIGKYVGVDRYYSFVNLANYFSLETYLETAPTTPPRYGYSTYATYDTTPPNGTLVYGNIITTNNKLGDDDYRLLIRLKIIENNLNYSHQQIDDAMYNAFGAALRPESTGHMAMYYFITADISNLIQAIISKGLLPKPMGVLLWTVTEVTGDMFALTDYTGYMSPWGYGFSDYADYATLPGQVLTYSQITEV